MLTWAITFFVLALVAALLGFTGIAAGAESIAKVLLILFAVGFVVSLILHSRGGRGRDPLI